MSKEKKINVIGMDVFQTAAVKRNYMNVKPLIKERNKMEEKIAELSKNLEIKKAQIAANDQHTGMITKETCGIALTSEQVMWFLEHPEEFENFKAAHIMPEAGKPEAEEPKTEEPEQEVTETPEAEEEQESSPFAE